MPSTDPRHGPADLVLVGGTVHTLAPATPPVSALAVRGERVAAVGDDATILDLCGPGTRTVRLAGRAVVPGFVDAHVHFGAFALTRRQVDLHATTSLAEGLALLAAAAPGTGWLRGFGWDRNRWGVLPSAADLDRATGSRPAALDSHDHHALWLNTAALERAGIGPATPDPPRGRIERDLTGAPTGVLFENARQLAYRAMPAPSQPELVAALREALSVAAAAGLTGIHNLEDASVLRAFQVLRSDQALTLRVFHGLPHSALGAAAELGVETGWGDDWLRLGPVKLFADGALGSRTAYLLEPYEGRAADGERGIALLEPEELRADLARGVSAGLGVAVHAIGDAAVRRVLDAMAHVRAEVPGGKTALLRIEHAQLVHPLDLPRFAQIGVIASIQPIHATSDWRAADAHWGARSRYAYAWRSLLDSGARLAFGTDAPVEGLAPLASLRAAVTRVDTTGAPAGGWYPEQRLRLDEALRAYTVGAAVAERADDRRGTLTPGRQADLVVLSADPFREEADALAALQVDVTVVGGRVVYER